MSGDGVGVWAIGGGAVVFEEAVSFAFFKV